jgi:hypothetical protein
MQLVSLGADHSTHSKALIKEIHGLSLGLLVSFLFPYKHLDVTRKQATD